MDARAEEKNTEYENHYCGIRIPEADVVPSSLRRQLLLSVVGCWEITYAYTYACSDDDDEESRQAVTLTKTRRTVSAPLFLFSWLCRKGFKRASPCRFSVCFNYGSLDARTWT